MPCKIIAVAAYHDPPRPHPAVSLGSVHPILTHLPEIAVEIVNTQAVRREGAHWGSACEGTRAARDKAFGAQSLRAHVQ